MPKQITSFVCQECGYDSPAYMGKCPECGAWNSFREFKSQSSNTKSQISSKYKNSNIEITPEPLSKIQQSPKERLLTGFAEMDNVLGGGIVLGSATLVAGDPGIGKSTLLLQLCLNLASQEDTRNKIQDISEKENKNQISSRKVLYVSAEESIEQVAMRAARLRAEAPNPKSQIPNKNQNSNFKELMIREEDLLLLSITDTDQISQTIQDTKPDFVVIDSIQTVESENVGGLSGSVGQVRYAAQQFIRLAKEQNIPMMMVGHVTKEGMVAGPMVLSHMVDTVLFLEGEKFTKTRILRSLKNRFGPVDEVGVFLMEGEGMQEVKNPEQIFLSSANPSSGSGHGQNAPGSVLVVIVEGTRPFLVEIQALAVYSKYPMPKRVASGIDQKRIELLLAVLQKHVRLPVETNDIFVNIAGGVKVTDPAVDLGVCLAIYSSLKNRPLGKVVGIGEVGLLGELRRVPFIEKRVKEAKKLGFDTIITSEGFDTLKEVLDSFGFSSSVTSGQAKKWKQEDERHFKLEEE